MRNIPVVFFVLVLAFVLEGCLAVTARYFRSTVAPATAAAYDAYYRSGWNIGGKIADDGKIQFHMFWPFWGTPSPARICVYRDSEFYGVYDLHAHRSPSFSGNDEVHIWIYDYASAEMTKANYRGVVQIDFGKDMRGTSRAEAMRDTCEAIRIRAHAPCVASSCKYNGGEYNEETRIGVFRHVRKVQ